MKALKIQVERVVRPIYASERRKDRMREELYAHLLGLYQEEVARVGNENSAFAPALARFGEPAELTASLQESVPAFERVLYWRLPAPFHSRLVGYHNVFRRRLSESDLHLATRLALYAGVYVGVLIPLGHFLGPVFRGTPNNPAAFSCGIAMIVAAPLNFFCFSLLTSGIRRALFPTAQAERSWWRACGMATLGGILLFASVLVFCYLLAQGQWVALDVPVIAGACLLWPVFMIGYALLSERDYRRYEEWGCLEIE